MYREGRLSRILLDVISFLGAEESAASTGMADLFKNEDLVIDCGSGIKSSKFYASSVTRADIMVDNLFFMLTS